MLPTAILQSCCCLEGHGPLGPCAASYISRKKYALPVNYAHLQLQQLLIPCVAYTQSAPPANRLYPVVSPVAYEQYALKLLLNAALFDAQG